MEEIEFLPCTPLSGGIQLHGRIQLGEDGFWGKPPPLLSLILSGVLILGKNGECYPGPFFPSLVDPKEIQKAKLQEFREFR